MAHKVDMQQSMLTKWLKLITFFIGIMGVVFFFFIVPSVGGDLARLNPELAHLYRPILLISWVIAIPCFYALVLFWGICTEIGRDNSFSQKNASALKRISRLALIDTLICFVLTIIWVISDFQNSSFLFALLFSVIGGLGISIISACLSYLVQKAVNLQEENELTI